MKHRIHTGYGISGRFLCHFKFYIAFFKCTFYTLIYLHIVSHVLHIVMLKAIFHCHFHLLRAIKCSHKAVFCLLSVLSVPPELCGKDF